jgi:hypothetical protein
MPPQPKPRLFVASSRENLELAHAIQTNIQHDADVTVWTQQVFKPSEYVLEPLEAARSTFDAGVFVLAPDDIAVIRGSKRRVARDNVIFELGLFIGALGRKRSFIVVPSGSGLHLPTDLLGLMPVEYESARADRNWQAALGPACTAIKNALAEPNAPTKTLSHHDIQSAGLFTDYTPVFDNLIHQATVMVLVFIHSRRWRENHGQAIHDFLSRGRSLLTVYMPEPRDGMLHEMFKRNFDDGQFIPGFMREADRYFANLKREYPRKVAIRFFSNYPTYSFYMIDNDIIFAMYPTTARRKPVPAFMASVHSRFGAFVLDDLKQLRKTARRPSAKELARMRDTGPQKSKKEQQT